MWAFARGSPRKDELMASRTMDEMMVARLMTTPPLCVGPVPVQVRPPNSGRTCGLCVIRARLPKYTSETAHCQGKKNLPVSLCVTSGSSSSSSSIRSAAPSRRLQPIMDREEPLFFGGAAPCRPPIFQPCAVSNASVLLKSSQGVPDLCVAIRRLRLFCLQHAQFDNIIKCAALL